MHHGLALFHLFDMLLDDSVDVFGNFSLFAFPNLETLKVHHYIMQIEKALINNRLRV